MNLLASPISGISIFFIFCVVIAIVMDKKKNK